MDKRCSAQVTVGWDTFQCSYKAVVERDGESYCKIHDPDYIAAKRKVQEAKWGAEREARNQKLALEGARNKATEGLTIEELSKVTPDKIRGWLSNESYEGIE